MRRVTWKKKNGGKEPEPSPEPDLREPLLTPEEVHDAALDRVVDREQRNQGSGRRGSLARPYPRRASRDRPHKRRPSFRRRPSQRRTSDPEVGGLARGASFASHGTRGTDQTRTTIDRTKSDVTELSDYGSASVEDIPREKLSAGAKAKAAGVMVATTFGIACYLAAFVAAAAAPAMSAASVAVLAVAGGVSALVVTPMVWAGEWKLTHMPTIRNRVNELMNESNRLNQEVDWLAVEEEDLRLEVESLKKDSEELERLVKEKNAGNVDDFVELVRGNQAVLKKMKEYLRQVVIQDVVKIVLQSDTDRDGYISRKESRILKTRLQISLETYGIVFDTEKFERAVGLSPSLYGVLGIVRRLLPDEHDRVSSFYSAASDSDAETDPSSAFDDDVYDMFYVPLEDEFKRGCADSIHLTKEYVDLTGGREQPDLLSLSTARAGSGRVGSASLIRCSTSSGL